MDIARDINTKALRGPIETGDRALCPDCDIEVIAKCGEINEWHWSHPAESDCSMRTNTETQWHRDWKDVFARTVNGKDGVTTRIRGSNKRADITMPYGLCLEFQHSPITTREIADRNSHYNTKHKYGVAWLFDQRSAYQAHRIIIRKGRRIKGDIPRYECNFIWENPRRSLAMVYSSYNFIQISDKEILSFSPRFKKTYGEHGAIWHCKGELFWASHFPLVCQLIDQAEFLNI